MPAPLTYDRPAATPRWADNPPVGPPTTITNPTSLQQDQGWQPGRPIREIMNWAQNLYYQWIAWLDQATHRTSDMHPDHAVPGGIAPTLAAGLVVAASDFSARVYQSGYEIPLTPSPAFTYTANRDTYWDLGRNAQWTATAVANLAAAPGVAANSVRVYAVRTNATDRTVLILDNRVAALRLNAALGLEGAIQVGPFASTGYGTAADQLVRGVTYHLVPSTGIVFQRLQRWFPDAVSYVSANLYVQNLAVPGNIPRFVLVWGADVDINANWTARATDAYRMDLGPVNAGGFATQGLKFSHVSGLTPNVSLFSDGTWTTETQANNTRRQLPIACGLRLGCELNTSGGGDVNITAPIEWVRTNGGPPGYTLKTTDPTAGQPNVTEYMSPNGTDIMGTCHVRAINCTWDELNTRWSRTMAGDSYLHLQGSTGEAFYQHQAAGPANWTDIRDDLSANNWILISASQFYGYARALLTGPAPASPIANAVYSAAVDKCVVVLQTVGGGSLGAPAWARGMNFTNVNVMSGTQIRITLATAMDSATQYGVEVSWNQAGSGKVVGYTIVDATHFDIILSGAGAPAFDTQVVQVTATVKGFQ